MIQDDVFELFPGADNVIDVEPSDQLRRRDADFQAHVAIGASAGIRVPCVAEDNVPEADHRGGLALGVFTQAEVANNPQPFNEVLSGLIEIQMPPRQDPTREVVYTFNCAVVEPNSSAVVATSATVTVRQRLRLRQELELSDIAPPPGDALTPGSRQSFRVMVSYRDNRYNRLAFALVPFDSAGNHLPGFQRFNFRRPTVEDADAVFVAPEAETGSETLEIQNVLVPDDGIVRLVVDMGSSFHLDEDGFLIPDLSQTVLYEGASGFTPVPEGEPILSTSRSGFVFLSQGSVVQQQPLEIVNTGGQELNWIAAAATLSGGLWLSVSPESGSTIAARPSSFLNVMVDPTGLAPGDYYGDVRLSNVSNNDIQRLTVVTRVLAEDAFLPAAAAPEGFLFVHSPQSGAGTQTLVLTNPGAGPLQLEVESFFETGVPEWFAFQPPPENILAAGASLAIEIQVASDFTPSVRSGELRITSRPSDGGNEAAFTQRIDARLIVPLAQGAAVSSLARQQAACGPMQLVPVLRRPSLDFAVVAGFPLVIEAVVFDDCGAALTSGSVTAEFSNGDPLLALEHLRDGRWVATWAPVREAVAANITLRATDAQTPSVEGMLEITGSIPETAVTPILAALPLSAVSFARNQPISVGAYAALFGSQLAGALAVADRLPLADTLDQTSVFISGSTMPLLFASSGQVNGIIPFDVTSGRRHTLLVQRGVTLSAPLQVLIVGAQPALFSKNSSGGGQALIERVSPDGSRSLAEPGTPARPGDVLVIYASGLGPVSGDVSVADASPVSPLAQTVNPVTISVGEVQAAVSFAGLTPGFAGLYQVNAALPVGAPVGNAVPVVASVAEATSPPVTIAIGP